MTELAHYGGILTGRAHLGRLPMERLRRVDQPTTRITDNIQRFDERKHGFNRARRGDFGPTVAREYVRFAEKYPLSGALKDMTLYIANSVDGTVAPAEAPLPKAPQIMSRHIKRLGYFLGADIVGICRLPQYAVYSYDKDGNPIELNHQFAVMVVIDQDYGTMNGSTGNDWISNAQSFRSYLISAFITCIMADYIRRLGYPARAHYFGHYQVIITPLLLLAGIGEMSRSGVVLNPFLGTRFKAAAVTTDLPLEPDKPVDFGLQEFCQKCIKCAIECPSQALPMGDKVMYNGYENWRLDAERCTKYRVTNQHGSSCGRCIKVCPWNKPEGWIHDAVRWMVKHTPLMDKLIIKMDDVWGYKKQVQRDKWWFDMEVVDGVFRTR